VNAARASREAFLGGLGATLAVGGCGRNDRVIVGSKDFTEELVLGELYAQRLAHAGIPVERKLNLAGTQVATEALRRGDIDLYPEYTGTALLTVLKEPSIADAARIYAVVRREYAARYDLVWLRPAPFDDAQALATTGAFAREHGVRTLSQLARLAPRLRLGAVPEFLARPDGLPGLRRAYGGFAFASTRLIDNGLKYQALVRGDVDVVVAFGTDGRIAADKLAVMIDDKRFWPAYDVAPVVRRAALARAPGLAPALDALAPRLTDVVMRRLNAEVDVAHRDPEEVAGAFLRAEGLG